MTSAKLAVPVFLVGLLSTIAMTFFSPGLRSEGLLGIGVGIWAIVSLTLLIATAVARRGISYWILVVIQTLLIFGLLVETFSDARLYLGT